MMEQRKVWTVQMLLSVFLFSAASCLQGGLQRSLPLAEPLMVMSQQQLHQVVRRVVLILIVTTT